MSKKIYLGSDHAGFKLKSELKKYFDKNDWGYQDLGNSVYDYNDDYPDFAKQVAKSVIKNQAKGILICGTAQGMAIAANKIKGIRAVAVNNEMDARLTREHNDANILCLSGKFLAPVKMKKIIDIWLKSKFSQARRHKRRILKISALEKS